jgi:hypothetical protein
VTAPDDGEIPLKSLAAVHIRAGMAKGRRLAGPVLFEPYLLVPDVKVRNVSTGEEKTFSQHDLALGVNTVFEVDRFYESPQLAMYYYCEDIKGDLATIYLVESCQLGMLFQAKLTMETKYANRYIQVADQTVIQRLQRRLNRMKAAK